MDNLEALEQERLEPALKEAADAVAEVGTLAHEKTVIDAALAALGSGTNKTWAVYNAVSTRPRCSSWTSWGSYPLGGTAESCSSTCWPIAANAAVRS